MRDDRSRTRSTNVGSTLREREQPYWQDGASAGLGGLLFLTPWLQRLTSHGTSSWNAWIVGALCLVLGLVALGLRREKAARMPNMLSLLAGVWLCVSPWVLGFSSLSAAAWVAVLIGVLLIIVNGWRLIQANAESTYEYSS